MTSLVLDKQLPIDHDGNRDDSTRIWFWCLVVGQAALWTIICLATQPNMPMDMVEMLYWGQQWQWGYHKHPPLPAWTAATMWNLGGQHPWALYLTAQLTITVTLWSVWQLAREMLTPQLAFCSVVVLLGCYYCTYLINDINNTIMTRPFWALTILFLYRSLSKRSRQAQLMYWCLTGVTIGLGMLCKYYMAVLVLCLMLVPVLIPKTRTAFRTPGPYAMAGIALAIFAPHFLWMIENDFQTISYAINRGTESAASSAGASFTVWKRHLISPAWFVVSQAGAFLPPLLLLIPLYFRAGTSRARQLTELSSDDSKATFDLKYLLIAVAGPIAFYLVLATLSGVPIRSKWGGPLFSFIGLLWLVAFRIHSRPRAVRWIAMNSMLVGLVMATGLFVRNGVLPSIRDKYSRIHYPGREVSTEVHRAWAEHSGNERTPLPVVGGHMFVAGCVGVYSPVFVDVYSDMIPASSPWTSDDDLRHRGGAIVWDADRCVGPPADWHERFPSMEILPPITCKSRAIHNDQTVRVGIGLVLPQTLGSEPNQKVAQTQLGQPLVK